MGGHKLWSGTSGVPSAGLVLAVLMMPPPLSFLPIIVYHSSFDSLVFLSAIVIENVKCLTMMAIETILKNSATKCQ